jgi:hypothetical protein
MLIQTKLPELTEEEKKTIPMCKDVDYCGSFGLK